MANASNCLTKWNRSGKIPANIVADLKKNNTQSLVDHIAMLKAEPATIEAKYKEAKDRINKEALKAIPAGTYVDRPDDPANELNNFKVTGLAKIRKNLIQRLGSIANVLKSHFSNSLSDADQQVLNDFTKEDGFSQQFNDALKRVFKTTEFTQFRYKDPIQYIPKRDPNNSSKVLPLDSVIKDAMAATVYEWVHTDGIMATGQTNSTIRQTFGLGKETTVPKAMLEQLGDVGMNRDYLADTLGRTILERINIVPTETADVGAKDRLIKSLGLQAIAVMENMTFSDGKTPMVERQEVYIGAVTYNYGEASGYGIAALKAGVEIDDIDDIFYNPSPEQRAKDNDPKDKTNTGKKGKATRVFIKLNTNQAKTHELHTDLITGKTLLNKAPGAFDNVFGTETVNKLVSWTRIKLATKAKIAEFGTASESQTANLQKSIDVVYTKSVPVLEVFQAITGTAKDMIIGVASMDNKLLIREKSVNGINRSIARDIQMIEDYQQQEEVNGSEFFLNAKFMANHRMRQEGMSPQNSKIIRNLFNPKSWSVSFNPKTDTKTLSAFKQAIALAFDIETLKVGGIEEQTKKFNKMLDKPEIKAALDVLQAFHNPSNTSKTLTEAQQMIVAKGVKETGTKVHGLKGLVEYARFLNHTDGEFTTDIYNEMDGVSNGPIIGMLMLIRDTDDTAEREALLGSLAMGGISVDSRTGIPNLDKLMNQHNLHDAYQRMADEWTFVEARMKAQTYSDSRNPNLTKDKRQEAQIKYDQLMALEVLLGRFTEHEENGVMVNDGVINKLIRKLSKPRTMQTMYGAMIRTQNAILSGENVIDEGIYDGIEAVITYAKSKDAAPDVIRHNLARILDNAKILSKPAYGDTEANVNIDTYYENGVLNLDKLQGMRGTDGKVIHQGFKLSPKQIKAIEKATRNTYGEAMKQAIDKVYAPVIAARKPFKTINQRAASVYNLVLQAKWNAAIAEKNKFLQADYDTKIIEADKEKDRISKLATSQKRFRTPEEIAYVNGLYPKPLTLEQEKNRLTAEEAKKITDSITYLIPKIKTPMGSDLYLAKRGDSNNEADINSKDYSDGATVEQAYANGTPGAKEYIDTIPYLKNLSVSGGMVRAIQMIDGMIANHMMGVKDVDLLNVHDATVHSIKDIDKINYEANNIFKEIMFGSDTKAAYSLGQAIVDMHNEMTKDGRSLSKILTTNGVKPTDQIKLFLADNVINPDTYGITEKEMEDEIAILQAIAKDKKTYLSYNDASAQALKELINSKEKIHLKDNMSDAEAQAFLNRLHGLIETNAITMAEQVTRNKEEVGKYITHVAQFPNNGEGVSYQSKSNEPTVLGVQRDSVLNITGSKADEMIAKRVTLRDLWKDRGSPGFSGSSATDISTEASDYQHEQPNPVAIDSQNVTEVFESILTLDAQAAGASVQNSPEHVADIKRILNQIVSKVMKPVTFYMAQYAQQNDETAGAYHNNTIWIQRQQVGQPASGMLGQGIRMSAAVVYAHEMIHHITKFGLKNNAQLNKQVYDLYDFTRDSLENTYGANAFKVFMNDPSADLNDTANAYEIIAAKARWEYMFNPIQRDNQTHAGLDEFLAFGMTDENFKRELATLAISQDLLKKRKTLTTVFEKNIQTTMVNLYTMVMDFVQHMFYKQNHSALVGQEIENLVSALAKVDAKSKNTLLSAAAYAEEKATLLGLNLDEKIKTVANKAMNTTQMGKLITEMKKLPEAENMIAHRLRVAMLHYKDQEQGFFSALWTEAKGTTERLRGLHALQARRQLLIDTPKQAAAANAASMVREWFGQELTPIVKTALTKVLLKGDISLLNGISSMTAIKGFIESPTQREAHIQSLLGQVRTLINSVTPNKKRQQEFMNFFEGGINDLAYGMITGEHFVEGRTYVNAHNLAVMSKSKYAGQLVNTPIFNELVGLLDQLASVASLRHVSNKDRHAVVDLMNTNPDAIEKVLGYHKLLKQQAADGLFEGSQALMEKGYVKTILNPRIQFEQGTLADEQAFADRGFKRHEMPFTRDTSIDPVQDQIYMYISHNGTINDLQSGIASVTRNKTKGANEYDIQRQLGNDVNPAFVADANNAVALTKLEDIIDNMFTSAARTKAPTSSNTMTPKFDSNGDMIGLRYIASEQTKDTVLQQFSEIDSVLGALASQMIDKQNTPVINAELVVALREMWESEKDKYSEAYVKIGPRSPLKRHRDIYNNLPPKTKAHILSEWGENAMWVSQDVVDLAFGQRKYSITEMFDKNVADRNMFERLMVDGMTFALGFHNPLVKDELESVKGRAVVRAKSIEDFMTQLTKLAKGNVIVRTVTVTWGNHVSNVRYLKSKGIPLRTIFTYQREALTSALQYQADDSKLQAMLVNYNVTEASTTINPTTKTVMLTNMSRQIVRLQHQLANNPSTAMIKAGLLPSIVDDINTTETKAPHKHGLDKAIDTGLSKLPTSVERFGRAVFMTEDTEGYKMANNAVKMTDYVGRYVLYKHYTSKGMTHKEAVSRVSDEFINFAPPTHRMLEYANNIGLIWYSKYQIRVLKHIKNLIQDHPFSTLATFLVGSTTSNNNIVNTIPFVTKNAGAIIGNPFSAGVNSIDGILPVHGIATVF